MSGEEDWRIDSDALTYFGHQQKKTNVADRRPVIRKAADLVGPGINAQATIITDFNNLLATYNGYYSAEAGAFGAPNADEAFVGITVMDATLGGYQLFTGLGTGSGQGLTWRRKFIRNPADYSSISWEAWVNESSSSPVGMIGIWMKSAPPDKHLILDGSSFSGSTYPELAAFLGSTVLPDLRNRTIYGVGSQWPLLSTDGLSEANRTRELLHEHFTASSTAPNHDHTGSTGTYPANLGRAEGGGTAVSSHAHSISPDGSHAHTGATLNQGDPYDTPPVLRGIGMNYIIRAAQ